MTHDDGEWRIDHGWWTKRMDWWWTNDYDDSEQPNLRTLQQALCKSLPPFWGCERAKMAGQESQCPRYFFNHRVPGLKQTQSGMTWRIGFGSFRSVFAAFFQIVSIPGQWTSPSYKEPVEPLIFDPSARWVCHRLFHCIVLGNAVSQLQRGWFRKEGEVEIPFHFDLITVLFLICSYLFSISRSHIASLNLLMFLYTYSYHVFMIFMSCLKDCVIFGPTKHAGSQRQSFPFWQPCIRLWEARARLPACPRRSRVFLLVNE